MGLKSGSRDAGLDEGESTGTRSDKESTESETGHEDGGQERTTQDDRAGTTNDRPTAQEIPYKLRRDKVNEGREQVPFFLRKEVISAEDDLQSTLEQQLGESVYKSDYREAAMIVAQRNPDLVATVLREWGYDLEG